LARATATYRINPEMADVLRAKLLRLIFRGESVIGRYGRRGHLAGSFRDGRLTATMRDERHEVQITLTFDESLRTFSGLYAGGGVQQTLTGELVARRKS
jgi:hypothetical protein